MVRKIVFIIGIVMVVFSVGSIAADRYGLLNRSPEMLLPGSSANVTSVEMEGSQ